MIIYGYIWLYVIIFDCIYIYTIYICYQVSFHMNIYIYLSLRISSLLFGVRDRDVPLASKLACTMLEKNCRGSKMVAADQCPLGWTSQTPNMRNQRIFCQQIWMRFMFQSLASKMDTVAKKARILQRRLESCFENTRYTPINHIRTQWKPHPVTSGPSTPIIMPPFCAKQWGLWPLGYEVAPNAGVVAWCIGMTAKWLMVNKNWSLILRSVLI